MADFCTGESALMDDAIIISNLNDFIFCPASIYFHNLYGNQNTITYQRKEQINGSSAHESIDQGRYSSRKDILTAIDVYSEEYGVVGKIDIYDKKNKELIERKRQIRKIYDGYIYQLYAQCFAMREMGYEVNSISLYSTVDNKKYSVPLPEEDKRMFKGFKQLIQNIRSFSLDGYKQINASKCQNCIYEPACDRGMIC